MRSVLLVSMKKNEISIKINEGASYKRILETLNERLLELKKLYKEAKNPIKVTGRFLTDKEMEEIRDIIKKEINVEVSGLYGIKKAYEQDVENSKTYFLKSGMRSGQRIETEGSVVILGDVNGGAEVIAGENIVILGILRGLAHAGAKGNKRAIIASHSIECPQLRIGNILKEIEKEDLEEQKQFASVVDDKIILK